MKSLLSICLVAGSALIASHTITGSSANNIPSGARFFACDVDGKPFTAIDKDTSLSSTFTYSDKKHLAPAALFIDAEKRENNSRAYFYIQPVNDDAPAKTLIANNNLYKDFYIIYKEADNTFYNSTTAPGNLEITAIDTTHKILTGKLNCILYSSTKKDWLIVTNGRFKLRF